MNRSFNNKPGDDDASEVWRDGDSAISGIRVRSVALRFGIGHGRHAADPGLIPIPQLLREMTVDPIDVMRRGQDRSRALRRS
ncbi:MAG: hypothetical protein R3F36_07460 [Candidatus Competibacteraceae bacterium]